MPCSHSSHHSHVQKEFLHFHLNNEKMNLDHKNGPYLEEHLEVVSSQIHTMHLLQSKLSICRPFCQNWGHCFINFTRKKVPLLLPTTSTYTQYTDLQTEHQNTNITTFTLLFLLKRTQRISNLKHTSIFLRFLSQTLLIK